MTEEKGTRRGPHGVHEDAGAGAGDVRGLDDAALDALLLDAFSDDALGTLSAASTPDPAAVVQRVQRALRDDAPAAEPPGHLRVRVWAAAAAALVLLGWGALRLLAPGGVHLPDTGHVVAATRTDVHVGARALAVAEPGAGLSWAVDWRGQAAVTQRAGAVFYRVEPGAPFVVTTPAGTVHVRGTSFVVALAPHREEARMQKAGVKRVASHMSAAGAGAAMALLSVWVLEGEVAVAAPGASQKAAVSAGQGWASDGARPAGLVAARTAVNPLSRASGRAAVRPAATRTAPRGPAAQEAPALAMQALQAENTALRDELNVLKAQTDALAYEAKQVKGEAVPFPEDLDDAYREDGMKESFLGILADMPGGELEAIDCSEYPCLVFGSFDYDGTSDGFERSLEAFNRQLGARYDSQKHSTSMHSGGVQRNVDGEKSAKHIFGVAVTPRAGDTEESTRGRGKRVRYRLGEYMETMRNP